MSLLILCWFSCAMLMITVKPSLSVGDLLIIKADFGDLVWFFFLATYYIILCYSKSITGSVPGKNPYYGNKD